MILAIFPTESERDENGLVSSEVEDSSFFKESMNRNSGEFNKIDRKRVSAGSRQNNVSLPSNRESKKTSEDDEHDHMGPSNERLLSIAFVSFLSFALLQVAFALIAGSIAMLGDSAAMIVDSITYMLNWFAERRKNRLDEEVFDDNLDIEEDPVAADCVRKRNKRKKVLQLEILPPLVSVITLVVVTGLIIRDSVTLLILDANRSVDEQASPNIALMLGFSSGNLALDFLNVFCFSRAKLFMGYIRGYPTEGKKENFGFQRSEEGINDDSSRAGKDSEKEKKQSETPASLSSCHVVSIGYGVVHVGNEGNTNLTLHTQQSSVTPGADNSRGTREQAEKEQLMRHYATCAYDHSDDKGHSNLNMCSAYTHVFADTLRSIAVIVAAILALTIPGVTPEEADSTAAIAVSILILLSLLPLLRGLVRSATELRSIWAIDRTERLL